MLSASLGSGGGEIRPDVVAVEEADLEVSKSSWKACSGRPGIAVQANPLPQSPPRGLIVALLDVRRTGRVAARFAAAFA